MKVPEHLVAAPAANQLDNVDVGARREEGHGTCGAEISVGYVLGFKS